MITQNVLMNIEDKQAVFSEAYRVLRSGGPLDLEALLAGPNEGLEYPVYWADRPEISFLATPEQLQGAAISAGFEPVAWKDVSPKIDTAGSSPPIEEAAIKLDAVYDSVPVKRANVMAGFKNGSIVDIYAVFRKPV